MHSGLQCSVAYTATRHTNGESSTMYTSASRPVSVLCCFIVDLVECWEDVVGELNFGDRPHTLSGCSNGESNKALLAEWCVEYSLSAKVGCEVHGAAEDSSKLDVLPKHEHSFICLQRMAECFIHGGVEVDTLCLAFTYVLG